MRDEPFSVFKRTGRRFYYVSFKNEQGGGYLPAISSQQIEKTDAIKTAGSWYLNGIPKGNTKKTIVTQSLLDILRKTDLGPADAENIVAVLRHKGLVKSAILVGKKDDRNFIDYLLEFWDFDNSPYVKERLRKNHGIHRCYVQEQQRIIRRYWEPAFAGKMIGEITRGDIEIFLNSLEPMDISFSRKNLIIKAGTIALRWASSKGIIDNDIVSGLTLFSGKAAERKILPPAVVEKLFALKWTDNKVKLANLLSCVTGLRAGEILGLRLQDICDDYLNICHSWNVVDKLKKPKNNEERKVQVPFPTIIEALIKQGLENPHRQGQESFIFYSTLPNKPMDEKLLLRGLRSTLIDVGMTEEEAHTYHFHSWRHFFVSYMKGQIADKLLKTQTGHKTDLMLNHYGDHKTDRDTADIQKAQIAIFGDLLPQSI